MKLLVSLREIKLELPGNAMRYLMRSSICESVVSEGMILLQCENAGDKTICSFVYSGKHYSDALIRQMARHLKNILSDIIERHDILIKDIRMVDEEERENIIEQGAGLVIEPGNKCVHHLFEEQAAKIPKATALICGDQTMTYEELNARANAIGRYLQDLGVGMGTNVGIGMERSIEAIVCILAILKTGAAYVIIDPDYPATRIKDILSDAQVSQLVTNQPTRFGYEGLRIIDYNQFADRPQENTANVVSNVTLYDAAYITFTSGSTGKPKGIVGMHLSIVTLMYYRRFFYKDGAADEVSALLSPLSFGASVCMVFMPLCYGIPLAIIPYGEEKDPYRFACRIYEHKITAFFMPTALAWQLCGLNDEGKKLLQSIKHVGIGGSEVTPGLICAVKQKIPNITITAGYAFSEIGGAAFDRYIEDADFILKENERIPMGKQSPNTRVYILDNDMNPVPVGAPGELYVSAPYLSRGYIGKPELTAVITVRLQ